MAGRKGITIRRSLSSQSLDRVPFWFRLLMFLSFGPLVFFLSDGTKRDFARRCVWPGFFYYMALSAFRQFVLHDQYTNYPPDEVRISFIITQLIMALLCVALRWFLRPREANAAFNEGLSATEQRMQHILINDQSGRLIRLCDTLADRHNLWRWRYRPPSWGSRGLRTRFLLWTASRKANVVAADGRCVGCTVFTRVDPQPAWDWEDESALTSTYYVLYGSSSPELPVAETLEQQPSLEKAREAARIYRDNAAQRLSEMPAGISSSLRLAMSAASEVSVCMRMPDGSLVPIE